MTANHFQPIHDAHAIVEQTIFFEFSPTLQPSMSALISLKDELREDFPSGEVLKTISLMVSGPAVGSAQGQPQVQEAAGLRLSRFAPDGSIDMSIHIDDDSISLSCLSYSSWKEIWPRQQRFIKSIFSKITGQNIFMTGVGMKWLDQFLYEGAEADYDARELLKTGSDHLNPKAFASGTRWHCHSGWFDNSTVAGNSVLNQVNVDAGIVNVHGNTRTAVTIDHIQVLRASARIDELAAFAPGAPNADALSGLMDALHAGNKRVLMNLLTDSTCERIGLKQGQVG